MRYIALTVFLALGAMPAEAECPSGQTLDDGQPVFLNYSDGWSIDLRRTSDGYSSEFIRNDEHDTGYRLLTVGGIVGLDAIETIGPLNLRRKRVMVDRSSIDMSVLNLGPNSEFEIEGMLIYSDGSDREPIRAAVRTGDETDVDLAGCIYRGYPVALEYTWRDQPVTINMDHVPELGLSVERAYSTDDGNTETVDLDYFGSKRPN